MGNGHIGNGPAFFIRLQVLNVLYDFKTLNDMAEQHMQP